MMASRSLSPRILISSLVPPQLSLGAAAAAAAAVVTPCYELMVVPNAAAAPPPRFRLSTDAAGVEVDAVKEALLAGGRDAGAGNTMSLTSSSEVMDGMSILPAVAMDQADAGSQSSVGVCFVVWVGGFLVTVYVCVLDGVIKTFVSCGEVWLDVATVCDNFERATSSVVIEELGTEEDERLVAMGAEATNSPNTSDGNATVTFESVTISSDVEIEEASLSGQGVGNDHASAENADEVEGVGTVDVGSWELGSLSTRPEAISCDESDTTADSKAAPITAEPRVELEMTEQAVQLALRRPPTLGGESTTGSPRGESVSMLTSSDKSGDTTRGGEGKEADVCTAEPRSFEKVGLGACGGRAKDNIVVRDEATNASTEKPIVGDGPKTGKRLTGKTRGKASIQGGGGGVIRTSEGGTTVAQPAVGFGDTMSRKARRRKVKREKFNVDALSQADSSVHGSAAVSMNVGDEAAGNTDIKEISTSERKSTTLKEPAAAAVAMAGVKPSGTAGGVPAAPATAQVNVACNSVYCLWPVLRCYGVGV